MPRELAASMRGQVLVAVVVVAMLATAGCAQMIPGEGDGEGERSLSVLISDQQNAIGEFERLTITVEVVAVHRADADEGSGWTEQSVDGVTVDLTQLTGSKAVRIADVTLEYGSYDAVAVDVSSVEGTLTDGSEADVELASDRLRIDREFAVGESVGGSYVFDVGVRQADGSGGYVLEPVVSESGAGVGFEENPDARLDGDGSQDTDDGPGAETPDSTDATPDETDAPGETEAPGETDAPGTDAPGETDAGTPAGTTSTPGNPTLGDLDISVDGDVVAGSQVRIVVRDDGSPVGGATVVVNGDVVGQTTDSGTRIVRVPESASEFEVVVYKGDAEGKRTYPVERGDSDDGDDSNDDSETAEPTETPPPDDPETAEPTETATPTPEPTEASTPTATATNALAATPL